MKLALLLLSLLSLSCKRPNDKEPLEKTKKSFGSPEKIGTLSDGREIFLVVRDMGSGHDHNIYFVGSSATLNQAVSQGKTTVNQITVLIDGVEYTKKEAAETP